MGFDMLATIFCFYFVKETRGKTLEIAAGTEWEVAENLSNPASETKRGHSRAGEPGSVPNQGVDNRVSVNQATSKTLEIIDVHDIFN